jgi:2-hydroxychromene-2-carboxylate isomerase
MSRAVAIFWFEFASTYSHVAAQRVEALAAARGVELRWRPFVLGAIFQAKGWTTSPFNTDPTKGAYMWRDMERLSARLGLPLKMPNPFPARSMLAARLAVQIQDQPEIAAFTRAVYMAEFVEGADIADPARLATIAETLGLDGAGLVQGAGTDPVKAALKANTDEAVRRGFVGAPTITVGDEQFWGNDRLEEALDWALKPWA